jgi:hypothetical protein
MFMDFIYQVIIASGNIFLEAALYVLFGFFVAALLRAWISPETVGKYFATGRFKSVFLASLLGVPIPL